MQHGDVVKRIDTIDMSKITPPVEIFGHRLRAARELRGLNQRELSEKLGIPPSSIAHFEAGRRKPSFDNVHRLATTLNVTSDYLLGLKDEPFTLPPTDPLLGLASRLAPEDRKLVEAILDVLVSRKRKP